MVGVSWPLQPLHTGVTGVRMDNIDQLLIKCRKLYSSYIINVQGIISFAVCVAVKTFKLAVLNCTRAKIIV